MKYSIIPILWISFVLPVFGQEYWQQEVHYKIEVLLDDKTHQLHAKEKFEYINHSPKQLTEMYVHLWPNAYKDRSTALVKQKLGNRDAGLYYAKKEDLGFIDSLDFKVNGKKVSWEYVPDNIDMCKLLFEKPIQPGEKVLISTPFRVKLPRGVFSRLGHMGESYQITQWYPKPAVYDQNGWHPMPYLDQGEFYSEFGSFDVSITLPENYVVGATGELVNGEKELEWLKKKVKETELYLLNDVKNEPDNSFPISAERTKTLRYRQDNIHDFGWFADKRWHVLNGTVRLPHSGRKVDTWVMFTDEEADLWSNAIEYVNDAVYYYSLWNGDYPYAHATAVDGALSAGGGMEYPMVTIIGNSGNAMGLETVIMHEVGHNWFYGILGSNERDHPWMDEGLNSFNENRYIETKYPQNTLIGKQVKGSIAKLFDLNHYKKKEMYYQGYLMNARKNKDQPIELESSEYTAINYGTMVYGKTSLVFDYLLAYLGEDVMDAAMQKYYSTWRFKHPQPNDLKTILEGVSGRKMDWFFNDLILTTKKLDYKIVSASDKAPKSFSRSSDSNVYLTFKNAGQIEGPLHVSAIKGGEIIHSKWIEGFSGKKTIAFKSGDYEHFKIDPNLDMPELKRSNNVIKSKGLFKKLEPLRLQWIGSLENPDKTQLFVTPISAWNENDKWMFGSAFYNTIFPSKKLEFVAMPLYSFSRSTILGSGEIAYSSYPSKGCVQRLRFGVSGRRYGSGDYVSVNDLQQSTVSQPVQFNRLKQDLLFEFKKPHARSTVRHLLSLSSYQISYSNNTSGLECSDPKGLCVSKFSDPGYYVNKLTWSILNTRLLNPYSFNLAIEQGDYFIKASLTGNYRFNYKIKGNGCSVRLFSGRFLYNDFPNTNPRFGFFINGNGDYLYDHIFLGRGGENGILSNQFVYNDGGFKSEMSVSSSQSWLTAMNLQSSLFVKLPVEVYADFGWTSVDPSQFLCGFGAVVAFGDIFNIYFPAYNSHGLLYPQYEKNIRFSLNLMQLNPLQLINKIDL